MTGATLTFAPLLPVWLLAVLGLAILLVALGFNLLGDGLRQPGLGLLGRRQGAPAGRALGEARLAVSEDRHREDMERLNRQHQEEVKTVASRYSRKG